MFRESPVLLFTGLTRDIGNPREYEKNVEEGNDYFQSVEIDTTIPVEDTNEWPYIREMCQEVSGKMIKLCCLVCNFNQNRRQLRQSECQLEWIQQSLQRGQ